MLLADIQPHLVHYLPIATTVIAAAFVASLIKHMRSRGWKPHLMWWTAGVFFYGVGTGLEGLVTLLGNTVVLNKSWYIAGALLGGYPLAQGTVYLLLRRRTANVLTAITLPFITVVAVLVVMSPVNLDALEPHRPAGAVLTWTWVRAMTPLINGYAALFLIGGAILSAVRYAQLASRSEYDCLDCGYSLARIIDQSKEAVKCPECSAASTPASRREFVMFKAESSRSRAWGNAMIAFGAILPGVGGSMAKAGMVEALYVGEFVGLIFIWAGYAACVRAPAAAASAIQREPSPSTV